MGARGGVRLLPLIDKISNEPHWMWTGATSPTTGYGCARGNNQKMTSAHRAVWEMLIGEIPSGMEILHHCDIKLCVNPNCLFVGTQYTNIQDAKSKGRLTGGPNKAQKGQDNNAAKYTEEQIIRIKMLLDEGNLSQRSIARMVGVNHNLVWNLKHNKTWTHIDANLPKLIAEFSKGNI